MNTKSIAQAALLALTVVSGPTWADTINPADTRALCVATQPASTGPMTREQVIDAMHAEKANGCWALTQFYYPAPYDAPLRAHVLAMQQAAARSATTQ